MSIQSPKGPLGVQRFPTHVPPGVDTTKLVLAHWTDHIVGAYAPAAPFLDNSAAVFSVGSCFAEEISKALCAHGIKAGHVFISERWNSAFALRRFLARTLHGTPYPDGFIVDDSAEEATTIPDVGATDLFILTFGLSVAWFRRGTAEVVLKPPKFRTKDALKKVLEDYEMRQTTVAENEDAILACIAEIKRFSPVAKIVVTLSPVPLHATVTGTPVIVDNTVSKSVLRVALNNVVARNLPDVFYWPSYECVLWYGTHIGKAFGDGAVPNDDATDMRHVRPEVVSLITALFKNYYFVAAPGG